MNWLGGPAPGTQPAVERYLVEITARLPAAGHLSPVPAAAAASASIVRLAFARRAALRCLAVRASLT